MRVKEAIKRSSEITYSGDQEDTDEDIGDLSPENLVPFHSAIALEFVGAIGLESVRGLGGGETFEGRGLVVFFSLLDCKSVEGRLWIEFNCG